MPGTNRGRNCQVTKRSDIPRLADILKRRLVQGSHESAARAEEALPEPLDWLGEVSDILDSVPADRRHAGYAQARQILFSRAEPALNRSKSIGPSIELDPDEAGAMEALVALDGSRPILALRGGAVDLKDPWIGKWKEHLKAIPSAISEIASCVGRIEEHRAQPVARFGTGVLYNGDPGLVLTAAHALRNACLMHAHEKKDGIVIFDDGPVIDFCGEDGSQERQRLKIIRGAAIDDGGPFVDAAVLKIRPFTQEEASRCDEAMEEVPAAGRLRKKTVDDSAPVAGSFCVVGYPDSAPPGSYPLANSSAVDWFELVEKLSGGIYGIKRLSPGLPLSQPDPKGLSPRERRFGHDATTLFGSSGSPVFAWNDPGLPVIGVHVTGAAGFSNFAEWIPGFSARLSAIETKLGAL